MFFLECRNSSKRWETVIGQPKDGFKTVDELLSHYGFGTADNTNAIYRIVESIPATYKTVVAPFRLHCCE